MGHRKVPIWWLVVLADLQALRRDSLCRPWVPLVLPAEDQGRWGFQNGDTPIAGWFINMFIEWKSLLKWMMTGGTPISGNA